MFDKAVDIREKIMSVILFGIFFFQDHLDNYKWCLVNHQYLAMVSLVFINFFVAFVTVTLYYWLRWSIFKK